HFLRLRRKMEKRVDQTVVYRALISQETPQRLHRPNERFPPCPVERLVNMREMSIRCEAGRQRPCYNAMTGPPRIGAGRVVNLFHYFLRGNRGRLLPDWLLHLIQSYTVNVKQRKQRQECATPHASAYSRLWQEPSLSLPRVL